MADTLTHNRKWWMSIICKAGVLSCFCCHAIQFRGFTFGAFKAVQMLSLHKSRDTTLTGISHRYGSGFSLSTCLQIYYLTVKKNLQYVHLLQFFQLCKHCIMCSAFLLPAAAEKVSDILKVRTSWLKETNLKELWSQINSFSSGDIKIIILALWRKQHKTSHCSGYAEVGDISLPTTSVSFAQ